MAHYTMLVQLAMYSGHISIKFADVDYKLIFQNSGRDPPPDPSPVHIFDGYGQIH